MTYRNTKKYDEQCRRLSAARNEKERLRLLNSDARDYFLPEKRITITVQRHDCGDEKHVFELMKGRRVDMYQVFVDGKPWKHCGLTSVLAGIRKSMPRILAEFT